MANDQITATYAEMVSASARDIAGRSMIELGKRNPNVLLLNSDLSNSTRTTSFINAFPERSINTGIAEQNMISVAAGLAHEGFQPIAITMAPFISMRACEQVRSDICYGELPVVLMGTYAGYSGSICGATHSGLEDCAIMSTMAGMTVLEPGDPWMIAKMLDAAVDLKKPVYIRLGLEATKPLYGSEFEYKIGKALIPSEGSDGAFIVSGICVMHAVEAAKKLKEEYGVDIRVVDMHTIKPIDIDAVLSAAQCGRIVCAQDHNIIGGLGYHVAAVLAEHNCNCKFKMLGCPDKFVPLATNEFLYKEIEIDVDGLVKNMKALL